MPDLAGAFEAAGASSALGTLQADIIAARARSELVAERDAHPLSPDDDSVQFHACHGPTRQVEALREALLELFDRHHDLQPRDVVVMTPDLGTYAPLVRAVFAEGEDKPGTAGWGPVGAPRIATYIADLGTRALNPLADVLMRALELVDGRLTAPALADFVALDPVRRRFGLDDADIARIRVWLHEAGARVGTDAEDRERSGLPPQYAFTLAFALDRLALGMTQPDDGVMSFHGVAPFDEMEGDAGRSFGPFAELCARLEGWRRRFRAPRPMDAWARELGELVEDLAAVSARAGFLRRELLDGLTTLQEEASSFDGSVSVDAITAILNARFAHGTGGDRLTAGGVTVCALAPMRSVPFRVVCLLGMDDGTFPRGHHARAFDAVGMHPRRGDRDPREEDRNLLLEAILATRAHLLVFYTGRDPRTDKVLAPAVPVGDLLDAMDLTFTHPTTPASPARTLLTRTHAVQPFASGGFRRDGADPHAPRPRRYDTRMHAAAMAFARSREGLPAFVLPTDVLPEGAPPLAYTIETLVRWIRMPVRTLASERLGLHLDPAYTTELPDREVFELGALDNWGIGSAAATAWMNGADDERTVMDRLALRGALPPGAPGRAAGRSLWAQTMTAAAALRRLYDGPLPDRIRREVRVEVPAAHGPVVVTGSAYAYGDALLRFSHHGPNDSKTLLPAWVQLVAVRAAGHDITRVHLVGADKARGVTVTLHVPTVEQARAHLTDLVALALEARTRPLPLVQKTSFAWAEQALKASMDDVTDDARRTAYAKARTAARGTWEAASPGAPPGESEDPTLALVFGTTPPYGTDRARCSPAFEALATRLWRPILAARSTR